MELTTYSLDQIVPILPLLQTWVKNAFIQHPYLWSPPQGDIYQPHLFLLKESRGLISVVKKGEEVLGVAAGVAFDSQLFQEDFGSSVIAQIKEKGFDPAQMIYMCYFLTAPQCRNEAHLVDLIYKRYLDFARAHGKTQFCYIEHQESQNKPTQSAPLEPWGHAISDCTSMDVHWKVNWPTLQPDGSVVEQPHHMEFFVKNCY